MVEVEHSSPEQSVWRVSGEFAFLPPSDAGDHIDWVKQALIRVFQRRGFIARQHDDGSVVMIAPEWWQRADLSAVPGPVGRPLDAIDRIGSGTITVSGWGDETLIGFSFAKRSVFRARFMLFLVGSFVITAFTQLFVDEDRLLISGMVWVTMLVTGLISAAMAAIPGASLDSVLGLELQRLANPDLQ